MTPIFLPGPAWPLVMIAWYEVMPASVAAAPCSQDTPSGIGTSAFASKAIFGWKPPSAT